MSGGGFESKHKNGAFPNTAQSVVEGDSDDKVIILGYDTSRASTGTITLASGSWSDFDAIEVTMGITSDGSVRDFDSIDSEVIKQNPTGWKIQMTSYTGGAAYGMEITAKSDNTATWRRSQGSAAVFPLLVVGRKVGAGGGAGVSGVQSVNGHVGKVQLGASDVGAYTRGESDNNFEKKIATGTIQQADDPKTKPEGDYYVTEKFTGAPSGLTNYVGVMSIRKDYDGSDNGGLIIYITDSDVYYSVHYAGGWTAWVSMKDYANATFLKLDGGGTVDGNVHVHNGEVSAEALAIEVEGEIGLYIAAIDENTGSMQPLDRNGVSVPNADLRFDYRTTKWSIGDHEIILKDVFDQLAARVKTLEDNSGTNPPPTSDLTLKDRTQDAAGITEITIAEGLELEIDKDDDSKATVRIAPQVFGQGVPSAYLAGMNKDKVITASEPDQVVFFDMPMTEAGRGILVQSDSYAIQDPTFDDPNVTGGTPTEILSMIGFEGKAPEDGRITFSVRVKVVGESEKILTNPNGKVIAYARQVKAGDELKPMFLAGLVQAKGLEYIRLHVSHTFANSALVIDHTKSFLCFQQIVNGWRTSVARNTFESKAGITFTPYIEQFGVNILDISKELEKDIPLTEADAGAGVDDLDILGLRNLTKLRAGIVNGKLTVTDNGTDIADFMLDMAADNHKTRLLRGHQVTFNVEIEDKDDAFNFGLFAWTGEPDAVVNLYDTRNNESIVLNPDFVQVANTFISEDVVSGIHKASVSGTVPDNANNIVAFLYPVAAQSPITLKVAGFNMSSEPFTSYVDSVPIVANELALHYSEQWARFIQNTQGFAALRYTYGDTEQPAPTGIQFKGKAPITIDDTVNVIAGSQAKGGEGAYKFGFDGTVSISTSVSVSNETDSDSTMNVFFRKVNPNGSLGTEIPDSRATFTVKAKDKNVEHSIPAFELSVSENDRIAIRILESAKDGGYLECDSDRQPLLETTFDIKQLRP